MPAASPPGFGQRLAAERARLEETSRGRKGGSEAEKNDQKRQALSDKIKAALFAISGVLAELELEQGWPIRAIGQVRIAELQAPPFGSSDPIPYRLTPASRECVGIGFAIETLTSTQYWRPSDPVSAKSSRRLPGVRGAKIGRAHV